MKDPNEQRALIAIVLCLVVFYVWSAFFAPKPVEETAATPETAGAPVSTGPGPLPAEPGAAPSAATPPPAPTEGPCVPATHSLETDIAHLGVSTCGGSIDSVQLPTHTEAVTVTPWWTWVWSEIKSGGGAGPWQPYGPQTGVLSLLGKDGHFATAGRGEFQEDGSYEVVSTSPLVLQHVAADGLTITKTFAPTASADVFDVSVRFSATQPLNGPFWVGVSDEFRDAVSNYDMAPHLAAVTDGSFQQLTKPIEVVAPKPLTGPVSWFGVENRYFLAALAPADPAWGTVQWAPEGARRGAWLVSPTTSLLPDQPLEAKFTLYVGPKYVERLAEVGHDLDKAANLGFWGFFSKILLFFLGIFHAVVKNWGLSIISLTFLVRLSFYPLSARAFRSGKAMQAVQPLLKEIQEKYKDDKEAQTRETMALFQKHNVNPVGGCLPMVMQMPVFFALYSGLLHTPDLFQAPFLYVRDLSAPDPFGVFPTFMALGMLFQQRLNPMSGMDPAQQQMMRFMPLIFALFMFGLPAGLSLYYALNTLLSILQQWYNTRSYKPPASAPA